MTTLDENLPHLTTTAVTRSLSDLHLPTWFALQALTISIRSAAMHPLSLAASRKRVSDNSDAPNTSGIVSILKSTYRSSTTPTGRTRENSVRNLYRGFGVAVVGNVIGEISCLWTVEAVKQSLTSKPGSCDEGTSGSSKRSSALAVSVAGASGDLVAIAITTPLCIVCDRQLTAGFGLARSNSYASASQTLRSLVHQQSRLAAFKSLYAGAPASVAMLPAAGVWWSSYSEAKYLLYAWLGPSFANLRGTYFDSDAARPAATGRGPRALLDSQWLLSDLDNPIINGASGVLASVVTATIFTPMAVVRTRLQTIPANELGAAAGHRRIDSWRIVRVIRHLYRADGVAGFYRGATVNVSMAVLDGLAFSILYELNKLGSDKALVGAA